MCAVSFFLIKVFVKTTLKQNGLLIDSMFTICLDLH